MLKRTRTIIAGIVTLATLAAIAFAVYLSLDPGNYFFYEPEDRAKWHYEPGSVAIICFLMLAESLVTLAALISPKPRELWLRCLLGLCLLGPWTLVSTMFFVHMPMYVLFRHLWVWLLVISLVLVGAASGIRQLFLRLHAPFS